MALTDQPYLPLYVDDWMNNNKLKICSLHARGLMIQIMCVMHKEIDYGVVLLKAKYKQNFEQREENHIDSQEQNKSKAKQEQIKNFSKQISRLVNSYYDETERALQELIEEEVLTIEGDRLICPRMVKDFQVSQKRAESGKKGGSKVTKQYGKAGYLYFISDEDENHKIGISVNPKNRLYRLRSDNKIPLLEIIEEVKVEDMGVAEDEALNFFEKERDGEWLKGNFNKLLKKFVLLKANVKAKSEANPVNVIVNENINDKEKGGAEEKTKIEPQKIVNLYHQFCPQLPKVQVISKTRKSSINARLREHGLNKITQVFQLAGESNFLNGENKENWSATFDWLIKPTNFVKVLEGNYKNKGGGNKGNQSVTIN